MSLTLAEIAYTAGIIDGEGSIGLNQYHPSRVAQIVPRVTIHNTDMRLLRWLQERFGGSISRQTRRVNLTVYHLQFSSRRAHALLVACLPYLIVKRQEAELTMRFYDCTCKRGRHLSDEERQRRIDLMMALRATRTNRYQPRGDKPVSAQFVFTPERVS